MTTTFAVWLYDSDVPVWDPNGILSWLADELDLAEKAGQRAWISASSSFVFFFRDLLRVKRRAS